jgi:hypothetical protein
VGGADAAGGEDVGEGLGEGLHFFGDDVDLGSMLWAIFSPIFCEKMAVFLKTNVMIFSG